MTSLFSILADSFTVLRRNLILMYPYLFFMLIVAFILSQTNETPSLDAKWITLLATLALMYFAFLAGWLQMIYAATYRWLHEADTPVLPEKTASPEPSELPASVTQPFFVLRQFFPGVGEFYLPFALGGLLHLAVAGLLIWGASQWTDAQGGIPPLLMQLAQLPPEQAQAKILALPPSQLEILSSFIFILLGTLLVYGVFYLLTMFWPSFVITRKVGALRGYGLSLRQFIRDPWRIIGLGLCNFLIHYALTLLLQFNDSVSLILWQFLSLLANVFFSICLFLYVLRVADGEQAIPPGHYDEQPPAAAS